MQQASKKASRRQARRPAELAKPGSPAPRYSPLDLARQIREARTRRGLSQAQLAARLGTSQPAVARMERGRVVPGLPMLERIAKAVGGGIRVGLTLDSEADVARQIDRLIDECRDACLWYQRPDYYPRTRADRLRILDAIQRHADRATFIRAGRLRQCLSRRSSGASAGS